MTEMAMVLLYLNVDNNVLNLNCLLLFINFLSFIKIAQILKLVLRFVNNLKRKLLKYFDSNVEQVDSLPHFFTEAIIKLILY